MAGAAVAPDQAEGALLGLRELVGFVFGVRSHAFLPWASVDGHCQLQSGTWRCGMYARNWLCQVFGCSPTLATIAMMPALIAAGRVGHASMTVFKSRSKGRFCG